MSDVPSNYARHIEVDTPMSKTRVSSLVKNAQVYIYMKFNKGVTEWSSCQNWSHESITSLMYYLRFKQWRDHMMKIMYLPRNSN